MMKKLIALTLSAALLLGSAAALTPEEAFPDKNAYPGYGDVQAGDWFASAAQVCYEVGLMTGTNAGFSPDKILTVGEVAAIAARMNEAITGEAIPAPIPNPYIPWYQHYVDYLTKRGVNVSDPEKNATRQEFMSMLSAVTPEDMLSPINAVTALPDTADAAVLAFYNAGILTGVDRWGTFAGDKTLTRAETAAMAARIARPALRQSFVPADYAPFAAAGLKPADVLFTNGVTAQQYLPVVMERIGELEAACAAEGVEFNWFHTYGEQTFLDYVKKSALSSLGVTRAMGTQLYQNFDVQVFYSRLIDLQAPAIL
ncbi:S-layer homology domain-containing protein [Lawsonibacter celer]|uniref:S-layer homology domain-containing protein n=1 Tax=Lawsonibacter celer TaxID=2986526 RepID=UPI0016461EBF|nr:S-layer homology domain-containing protein [Lawsonibacter celer]